MCTDHTQMYASPDPGNKAHVSSSSGNLLHCITDIQLLITNHLKKMRINQYYIYIYIYMASLYYSKSIKTPCLQIS